jgi:hypothetical protein
MKKAVKQPPRQDGASNCRCPDFRCGFRNDAVLSAGSGEVTIPVSQALPKAGRMASAETAARATSSIVHRIASTYPQPKTRAASRGSSQASDAGMSGSSFSQASGPAPANTPLEAASGTRRRTVARRRPEQRPSPQQPLTPRGAAALADI